MSEARTAVLAAIRRALEGAGVRARGAAPPGPAVPEPGAPPAGASRAELLERFRATLERAGGHVHVVASEAEAASALRGIAASAGATRIACSDAPLARELAAAVEGASVFDAWADRERLIDADLGVTGAQHGIAETGTLVLVSSSERHRLASLVPPLHVAVLEAQRIVPGLGDAIEAVRGTDGSPPPLVTFVTGPSRTGDIELTIVVGVHGPKDLHVVVIDR